MRLVYDASREWPQRGFTALPTSRFSNTSLTRRRSSSETPSKLSGFGALACVRKRQPQVFSLLGPDPAYDAHKTGHILAPKSRSFGRTP